MRLKLPRRPAIKVCGIDRWIWIRVDCLRVVIVQRIASKSVIESGVAAVTALKTGRRVLIAMQVNTPLSDSPLPRTRIAVSPRTRIAVSPAS